MGNTCTGDMGNTFGALPQRGGPERMVDNLPATSQFSPLHSTKTLKKKSDRGRSHIPNRGNPQQKIVQNDHNRHNFFTILVQVVEWAMNKNPAEVSLNLARPMVTIRVSHDCVRLSWQGPWPFFVRWLRGWRKRATHR